MGPGTLTAKLYIIKGVATPDIDVKPCHQVAMVSVQIINWEDNQTTRGIKDSIYTRMIHTDVNAGGSMVWESSILSLIFKLIGIMGNGKHKHFHTDGHMTESTYQTITLTTTEAHGSGVLIFISLLPA